MIPFLRISTAACLSSLLLLLPACSLHETPEPIPTPTITPLASAPNQAAITAAQSWFSQSTAATSQPPSIAWSQAQTDSEWVVAPLTNTFNLFASEQKHGYRYLVTHVTATGACAGRIVELVVADSLAMKQAAQIVLTAVQPSFSAHSQAPAQVANFTGWVIVYSAAYEYEYGFVYADGTRQPQRVQLRVEVKPKSNTAKTNRASKTASTSSFDNELICYSKLICGTINGQDAGCVWSDPICDTSGGGGGDGGGWGGGGGTGPSTPPKPQTPCDNLTNNGKNSAVQNELNRLKNLINQGVEYGTSVTYDQNGVASFNSVTGTDNEIDPSSQTCCISSFTHTHPPGKNSIFSAGDVRSMAYLYSNGKTAGSTVFTMNVMTAQGTFYALSITDLAKYNAFIKEYFTTTDKYDVFKTLYASPSFHGISPSTTIEYNEAEFLDLLDDLNSGLTLYKGNLGNFSDWKKLSKTQAPIPCN